jgi:ribulose-phosphate 3-epimerase
VEPRAVRDVRRTLRAIRDEGADAAVALNPETPVERVFPYLELVSQVLVMSVSPGFGGQPFRRSALRKIRALRRVRAERGLAFRIGVDGGVSIDTAPACLEAGADVLVAGTAVFGAKDPAAAISRMESAPPSAPAARRRSKTAAAGGRPPRR